MSKILAIAGREFRSFWSDAGDVAFSLALPAALALLMVLVFGGEGRFHPTAYVVNADGDRHAEGLVALMAEDMTVQLISAEEAEQRLDRSEILQFIVIPEGFTERVEVGEAVDLTVRQRGSGGLEGQVVRSMIRQYLAELEVERDIRLQVQDLATSLGWGMDPDTVQTYAERFIERDAIRPLLQVSQVTVGRTVRPIIAFLPGILTMFLLFTVTLNAQSMVEERLRGTLARLIVVGVTPGVIFAGKFVAQVAVGMVQVSILLILAHLAFDILTISSFLQSLALASVFLLAISGVGLLLGSLCSTRDQAQWSAIFITMGMSIAGGTFFDPTGVGGLVESVARWTLNYHASYALRGIMSGEALADQGPALVLLLGAFAVTMSLAMITFRPTTERSR